jgi:hypothetical protein
VGARSQMGAKRKKKHKFTFICNNYAKTISKNYSDINTSIVMESIPVTGREGL